MAEIDWPTLHHTRRHITRLETELDGQFEVRRELILAMAEAGMGQREIGAYWKISQPRISQIINEGRAALQTR